MHKALVPFSKCCTVGTCSELMYSDVFETLAVLDYLLDLSQVS